MAQKPNIVLIQTDQQSAETLGEAVSYIENAEEDSPFFMWLSFPDPHTPYQVPEPYASMYHPEDIPLPPEDDLETKPERQKVAHLMDAMDKADKRTIQEVRAIHYGMIQFIDDSVGKVLKALQKKGMEDETIVIFTSDHGDSMGAHGLIQKHNAFYDSITHVPLIFSYPGIIRPRTCKNLVELIDLMPTVLDLAGCSLPHGIQGKSFAPCLRDEDYTSREFVVIEGGEDGEPMSEAEITVRPDTPFDDRYFVWCAYREAFLGKGKSIRTHDWKLNIYVNGEGELYDLLHDPHELQNLYGLSEFEPISAELKHKLLLWSFEHEDKIPPNHTVNISYREKYC
ncbi:sulfatase-like hydrolase/transferase [Salibacterium aidingense]|uniref:sulfatase-like hydrolase/transferase n=1 Tax=Salibacterium aidingense TaxID=384933 RepID=UPI003BC10109